MYNEFIETFRRKGREGGEEEDDKEERHCQVHSKSWEYWIKNLQQPGQCVTVGSI